MVEDIVQEATTPCSPGEVWRAITTSEALASWMMPNTLGEPVVGHAFQLRDTPRMGWNGVMECKVTEVVHERRFAFTMRTGDDPPTEVTFDLEPHGAGTRLRVRHAGFAGLRGWLMRTAMNSEWGAILRRSIPYVATELQAGRSPSREETTAVKKRRTAQRRP